MFSGLQSVNVQNRFQVQFQTRPQNSFQNKPLRFGCRLFALATTETNPEKKDCFIRQCLLDGRNSLIEQVLPKNKEDVLQQDGYGLATYPGGYDEVLVDKTAKTANTADSGFFSTVKKIAQSNSPVTLAHLRAGPTKNPDPRDENAHPFAYGKLALMHNGQIPPNTLADITKKMDAYNAKNGLPTPQGGTDTEIFFDYLISRLHQAGERDFKQPEPERLKQVFQTVVNEVKEACLKQDPTYKSHIRKTIDPDDTPIGLNFIVSDGKQILASCYDRPLYLGIRQAPNGGLQDVMLSTERIQPQKTSAEGKITWKQIPNERFVTIKKESDGKLSYIIEKMVRHHSSQ